MVATGKSVWLNFLGSEIKFVQGQKYRSRIAEAGRNNSETLILLHGGGGHLESFAFNVVPLSETFHVIAVEMLWHGLSDGPPIEEDRNAQTADQVLDIMDTMGLDRVWLHGEAAGASVVTSFALRRPERLKGAIFESGAGVRFKEATTRPPLPPVGGIPMGERTLQLLKNPTWQGVKDRLLMVMHFNHPERVTDELVDIRLAHYSRPSTNDAQTRYYTYSAQAGRVAPVTEEEIAGIRLPVLVVWSDGSSGAGPDAGQRLASLIPGAQFKLLPETGFWAHWEEPDAFNEAVRQFIFGEKVT
jgi:2-hydroxy-6-oxonona-2,4-dienedioate hydrolase